jgi:hypothetical protein
MHTADIPSSFSNAALRAVVDTAFCEAGANAEAAAKREAKRTNFIVEFVVSDSAKARLSVPAIFRVQVHRHEASVGFAESCVVQRGSVQNRTNHIISLRHDDDKQNVTVDVLIR